MKRSVLFCVLRALDHLDSLEPTVVEKFHDGPTLNFVEYPKANFAKFTDAVQSGLQSFPEVRRSGCWCSLSLSGPEEKFLRKALLQ